jgi:hypothetical protein
MKMQIMLQIIVISIIMYMLCGEKDRITTTQRIICINTHGHNLL